MRGFTLVEILISLFIFGLLVSLSVVAFGNLGKGAALANQADEIAAVLRLAQNKTLASESSSQYGVYFNSAAAPHEYELFQGTDYATGVVQTAYQLADGVEFGGIAFAGLSGQEVVFERVSGTTNNEGDAILRLQSNPSATQTVYVESSGKVEVGSSVAASDTARLKDTRHVHVEYSGRTIDTSALTSETLRLDFAPSLVTYDIALSDYVSGGQVNWEGDVDVDGEMQKLRVATHKLNSGALSDETEFSVHRDGRFNTKRLLITLSGDGTGAPAGKLIQYESDGSITTGGESSYVVATSAQ